ncbi:MAG TPA: L,D-transpeptidase [Jatrophihabitantaceae bacterium]|nr:L,D-transpeptidase [Jatrophihabitantaceae bacterium]
MLQDDTYGPPTYGVGMPIIVSFSARITEARDFVAATTVQVDGHPARGYWYFEVSADRAFPVKASFVPYTVNPPVYAQGVHTLWPANSRITMTMKTKGVSAGTGMTFANNLSLHMNVADAHISTVDCAEGVEHMVSRSNGVPWRGFPVSCGSAQHPTYTGVKVVMQKGEPDPASGKLRPNGAVIMRGPGYESLVNWSVRITNSGEYVHDAPWNIGNIGTRSTSHGCTNLRDADAIAYYNWARVGDVVLHSNTGGGKMPFWDGYGTHNLSLAQLRTGGLVSTR